MNSTLEEENKRLQKELRNALDMLEWTHDQLVNKECELQRIKWQLVQIAENNNAGHS